MTVQAEIATLRVKVLLENRSIAPVSLWIHKDLLQKEQHKWQSHSASLARILADMWESNRQFGRKKEVLYG